MDSRYGSTRLRREEMNSRRSSRKVESGRGASWTARDVWVATGRLYSMPIPSIRFDVLIVSYTIRAVNDYAKFIVFRQDTV